MERRKIYRRPDEIFENCGNICLAYGLSFEEAVKILVKCQKNKLENFDQEKKIINLDNFFDCMRSPVSGRIVEN